MTQHDNFKHINDRELVSRYAKALKKGGQKSIVDFDSSLSIDFHVQLHRIENLVQAFQGYMPPNRISHYVIAFITHGSGTKTIGQYTFNISANTAMIFPKKVIHSTNTWSLDTTGYMLTFNDDFFRASPFSMIYLSPNKLFKLSRKPYENFPDEITGHVQALFEDLFSLKLQNIKFKDQLLQLKIAELLFYYKSVFEVENGDNKKSFSLFDGFVELVEQHFRKEPTVQFYADRLTVHPNYLNSVVKNYTDCTAKQFIQKRIIQEASYMLISTPLSIKEIAFDLGFDEVSYFSRFFKSQTKKTPQEYRAE